MRGYFLAGAVVLSLALTVGAWFNGKAYGVAAEAARHAKITKQVEADLAAVADQTDKLEVERLAVEAAQQELQRKLGREAEKDINADDIAIGLGSVRRLNQARGTGKP